MNIGDVITTADELNALAQYSVVVDDTGETWVKDNINMWVCAHGAALDADEVVRWHTYPLTVVALPSRPERVVKAEALREAAEAWQTGGWAEDSPPGQSRPALILGMAQRAVDYLRRRADRIEAGDAL